MISLEHSILNLETQLNHGGASNKNELFLWSERWNIILLKWRDLYLTGKYFWNILLRCVTLFYILPVAELQYNTHFHLSRLDFTALNFPIPGHQFKNKENLRK